MFDDKFVYVNIVCFDGVFLMVFCFVFCMKMYAPRPHLRKGVIIIKPRKVVWASGCSACRRPLISP